MGCHSPGAGDRMFLRTVSAGDGTGAAWFSQQDLRINPYWLKPDVS